MPIEINNKLILKNTYGEPVTVVARALFLVFFLLFTAFRLSTALDLSGHCSVVVLISPVSKVFFYVASSLAEKYSWRLCLLVTVVIPSTVPLTVSFESRSTADSYIRHTVNTGAVMHTLS